MIPVNAVVRKPSAIALVLTIPLLFFGILMFLGGWLDFSDWKSESAALIALDLGFLATGLTTVVAALWILASLGRKALPVRIAALSAIAAGTLMLAGTLSYVLPCSGPA